VAAAIPAAVAAVRDLCGAPGTVTIHDFPLAGLDEDDLTSMLGDIDEEQA
jgi:hypothetical protein